MAIPDYEGMLEVFYRKLLRKGDVCIDIGAHLGRHAFPIAACVGATGAVHAFEPLPHIRAEFERRVAAQAGSNIAPIHVSAIALSDRAGTAEFVCVEEFPEYSGLRERIYDTPVTRRTICVQTRRLDSYQDELPRVRFIKIDAEGAEFLILRGAGGLLERDRPVISFECGDNGLIRYEHSSADVYDLIAGYGYRVDDILGTRMDRESFVRSAAEQRVWDYVALPD